MFPIRDANGKVSRIDECICPVDFDWTEEHAIRDKEFNKIFSTMPKGVGVTWVSDSCHSGDLGKAFLPPNQKAKAMPMPADIQWRMRTADTAGAKHVGFEHVIKDFGAVLVSGCGRLETSTDAEIDGRYNGALTYFFLKTLHGLNGLTQPLESAVARTRAELVRNGYAQHPQLQGAADLMVLAFLSAERKKKLAVA